MRVIARQELPPHLPPDDVNRYCVQIENRTAELRGEWLDYASIKDDADLAAAQALLRHREDMRLVDWLRR